ncbi:hypothetical protein IGI04_007151 [Brassica rapa subsp. trilocularis]|uniref:Uncharacterized protein n=1 Tax=Brassica rapa subsp. trilocularis TaxID=1813537 RepID=A0ABQ7NIX6_BRACM|nr:hypothetical protein IGI04_007151 [Brassica rapa subsp. trilocularis]
MENLWKTYVRLMEDFDLGGNPKTYERLLEDLWKTPGRLMEDFDLGGKPKLFQNLGVSHKFY